MYGARASDVRTVLIGGRVVVRDGRLLSLDRDDVVRTAREQRARLLERVRLALRAGARAGAVPELRTARADAPGAACTMLARVRRNRRRSERR